MGKNRDLELRREALQLAGQLPPNLHEARLVLDLMRRLVDTFIDDDHDGNVVSGPRGGEGG